MKIYPKGAQLFHTEEQTWRDFSQFSIEPKNNVAGNIMLLNP
jgi:hypothetical protein